MAFIKANNNDFNFHGRWEETAHGFIGNWCRPYVEFIFKGSEFTVVTKGPNAEYIITVDGEKYVSTEGKSHKLTVLISDSDSHLIRIAKTTTRYFLEFVGIETEGEIEKAHNRKAHYLFIGDSLVEAGCGFSAIIPEQTNSDYTCIAQGGLALCRGRGYYPRPADRTEADKREGMEDAFYNWQTPIALGEHTPYDITKAETPDYIFISLATNDMLFTEQNVPGFLESFDLFVGKIRALYPNAPIYLPMPYADSENGLRRDSFEKAAIAAENKYPNTKFISVRDWDVEISSDNIHPTGKGYAQYAENLMKATGIK